MGLTKQRGGRGDDDDPAGVQATVAYLQQLGGADVALVCEYSKWVLESDAAEGLRIFTSSAGEGLDQAVILDHLTAVAPACVRAYVEHVVTIRGDPSPALHDELIVLYLKDLQAEDAAGDAAAAVERRREVRSKLTKFLRESAGYTPERFLANPAFNDLLAERAVLLQRIGQHEAALHIYVHRLGQLGEAGLDEGLLSFSLLHSRLYGASIY